MSYTTGLLNERVQILEKIPPSAGEFGIGSAGVGYCAVGHVWAAVDWARGTKALREGVIDAYDTVMIRCRWTPLITRESIILHCGRAFAIMSLHADKRSNTIQLTATELAEQPEVSAQLLTDATATALIDADGTSLCTTLFNYNTQTTWHSN